MKATLQDKEIVKMLADGKSGKTISEAKKINYNTLAFNLSVIRAKYGCKNTNHLIAYFFRNKLIE